MPKPSVTRHVLRPTIRSSPVQPAHPPSHAVTGEPARPLRSASRSPKKSQERGLCTKTRLSPRSHGYHHTRNSTSVQVRLSQLDPRTYQTSLREPDMLEMLAPSHGHPTVNPCQCNLNLLIQDSPNAQHDHIGTSPALGLSPDDGTQPPPMLWNVRRCHAAKVGSTHTHLSCASRRLRLSGVPHAYPI